MAGKNYKITLVLTPYGASEHNQNSMDARITHAIGAATRHHVKGKGGGKDLNKHDHREPPDTGTKSDGTIVWHVHGDVADVNKMLSRWAGNADPDDPGNYKTYEPNVYIVAPEET